MKNKRNIIIASVIIILLIAGIAVIYGIDTEKKESVNQTPNTSTVYSADASDIAEVRVKTADGEIAALNKGKSDWAIEGLNEGEFDPQKAYSLAGTVSTIISKNVYEAPSDLSEYGLASPAITVTITKKNGDTDTVYVGDLSPVLGEYFIRLEGDDNVYTLYSYKVDTLLKPLSYYKEFNRFMVNVDDITDIAVKNGEDGYEIKLLDIIDENTNNVWEMVRPYEAGANDDYIDNKILAQIENIALTEPADTDGGITDTSPVLTLTVKPYDSSTGKYGTEYTETLTIGKTEGDVTYVMYRDEVYATASSSVSFIYDNPFNIVSKLHALVDISLVKSVDVEYGDEKHTIGITKESGNQYGFALDGKETDAKISQEIYRNIIALAVDAVYDGTPTGETLLKVMFNGISEADTTLVEIKAVDDLNCVMERNGEAEFTIKKSKVDELITLFDAYVKAQG